MCRWVACVENPLAKANFLSNPQTATIGSVHTGLGQVSQSKFVDKSSFIDKSLVQMSSDVDKSSPVDEIKRSLVS